LTNESALWGAVMETVAADLRNGRLGNDYLDSDDFEAVATLAGLDADAARDALRGQVEGPGVPRSSQQAA